MPIVLFSLVLALCQASAGRALAGDGERIPFILIVNPDNRQQSAKRSFLEDAFLKNTTRWDDGVALRPVDQSSRSAVRPKFCEIIIRRTLAAVRHYWQQRIFSGRGVPPPELASDTAVVRYVLEHRGAVGYVSRDADVGRARVLAVELD
jgi:hypothetical protein